jgi:hypothetical protein
MTGAGSESAKVVLRHLQITGGRGVGFGSGWEGAAIQNLDDLTLIDCLVTGNKTRFGGAIDNDGVLTITDSVIRGNVGGALWNVFYGRVTITRSVIRGNTSSWPGGGIWNEEDAFLTITDSVVRGNRTTKAGGGIWNGGTLRLRGTKVTSNTAGRRGGGIFNDRSTGIVRLDATSSVRRNTPDDCYGTRAC